MSDKSVQSDIVLKNPEKINSVIGSTIVTESNSSGIQKTITEPLSFSVAVPSEHVTSVGSPIVTRSVSDGSDKLSLSGDLILENKEKDYTTLASTITTETKSVNIYGTVTSPLTFSVAVPSEHTTNVGSTIVTSSGIKNTDRLILSGDLILENREKDYTLMSSTIDTTNNIYDVPDYGKVPINSQLEVSIPNNITDKKLKSNITLVSDIDTESPIITLLGDTTMTLKAGSKYLEPGYTAIDNIDEDITDKVVVTQPTDLSNTGSHIIKYDVKDSSGNSSTVSRTINVVDTVPPEVTLIHPLECGVIESGKTFYDPGYYVTDNDPSFSSSEINIRYVIVNDTVTINTEGNAVVNGEVVTIDSVGTVMSAPITTIKHGNYIVEYTATDPSGNISEPKYRTFTAIDTLPPVITLNGDRNMIINIGDTYTEPGYVAIDLSDGDLTNSVKVIGSVDNTSKGLNTITYSVSDLSGNTTSTTRNISVVDTLPPVLTLLGETNITIQINTAYTEPGYTAIDNADGDVTNKVKVEGSVDATVCGTYSLLYTVSDVSGNIASKTRTVNIVDTIPPVLTLKGQDVYYINDYSKFKEPGIVVTDNSNLPILDSSINRHVRMGNSKDIPTELSPLNEGTLNTFIGVGLIESGYDLTRFDIWYEASDTSGNIGTSDVRSVYINKAKPVISLIGDDVINVEVKDTFIDPGVTATDLLDGVISNSITSTAIDTNTLGTQTIIYTVTNSVGTTSTISRDIIIQDTKKAVLKLTGLDTVTLEVHTKYIEPGYSAIDNYDGDITNHVIVESTVNEEVVGNYNVKYSVTDGSGNISTVTRNVNIVDTIKPQLTLAGDSDITLHVYDSYNEPGYTAIDNYDGDITSSVKITNSVDTNTVGMYTLIYSVTDANGNTTEQTRNVRVIDTEAPVLTLLGDKTITLEVHNEYIEPGYTSIDNYDKDISDKVVLTSTVDNTIVGSYRITYTSTDSSGNTSIDQRIVNFVDTTPPVINLLGDLNITLEINKPYIEPGYSAIDNYDGDITDDVIITSNLDNTKTGDYTITYKSKDFYNNEYSITRNVTVVDTVAPVITLVGAEHLHWGLGKVYEDPGITVVDNSGEDLTDDVIVESNIDTSELGEYQISFHVADYNGNMSTTVIRYVKVVKMNTFEDNGVQFNYIHRGEVFKDPGVIAILDDLSINTTDIQVTNTIKSEPGTYPIIYTFIGTNPVHIPDYIRYVKVLETGQIPYKEENPFSWDEQYLYGTKIKTRKEILIEYLEEEYKAFDIGRFPIDVIPDIGYPDDVKNALVGFNSKRKTSILLLNENNISKKLDSSELETINSYNDPRVFRFFQHVIKDGKYSPITLEVLGIIRRFKELGMKMSITQDPVGELAYKPLPAVISTSDATTLKELRINYAIKSFSGFRLDTEKADIRSISSPRYFLFNTFILNRLIDDMLIYLETSRHLKHGMTNNKRKVKADMKSIVESYSNLMKGIKYMMTEGDNYLEHVILVKFSSKGRYHKITITST